MVSQASDSASASVTHGHPDHGSGMHSQLADNSFTNQILSERRHAYDHPSKYLHVPRTGELPRKPQRFGALKAALQNDIGMSNPTDSVTDLTCPFGKSKIHRMTAYSEEGQETWYMCQGKQQCAIVDRGLLTLKELQI